MHRSPPTPPVARSPAPPSAVREAVALSADFDGLGEFLRRAPRTKLLSAPEELDLARRIERGDLRARDRMIDANLLLVVSVARRYRHPGRPLADLIQEGTIGLIRAVEKFDHRRGNRFSTYAAFRIREHVARAVAEKSRLVCLPSKANARLLRLKRTEDDLRAQTGRAPTSAELAISVDMPAPRSTIASFRRSARGGWLPAQCAVFPTHGPRRARKHGGITFSVLLVDDDPTFRRLARRLLGVLGLKDVTEAGTVAEALATAVRLEPASALVDVELPDGDGFDLAAKLAGMPWRPRIVVTSAQFSDGFDMQARSAGAEAFVPKSELARAPLKTWLSER
jgi:RNA polymerase sigma factor (sigma-70 family)